jgi:hypothetical protein
MNASHVFEVNAVIEPTVLRVRNLYIDVRHLTTLLSAEDISPRIARAEW